MNEHVLDQKQLWLHFLQVAVSSKKITLMLEELSEISSSDRLRFFSHSKAIDIENALKSKLSRQFEAVENN
jgi:hypothetical protein